jgi:hypothetical protein
MTMMSFLYNPVLNTCLVPYNGPQLQNDTRLSSDTQQYFQGINYVHNTTEISVLSYNNTIFIFIKHKQ